MLLHTIGAPATELDTNVDETDEETEAHTFLYFSGPGPGPPGGLPYLTVPPSWAATVGNVLLPLLLPTHFSKQIGSALSLHYYSSALPPTGRYGKVR